MQIAAESKFNFSTLYEMLCLERDITDLIIKGQITLTESCLIFQALLKYLTWL